ncbi:MAG: amidase [Pseudomonadota bacterium]
MTVAMHYETIEALAPRLRNGTLSPVELTETMLVRIGQADRRLHAYATVMAEAARARAITAAEELGAGIDRGPLHGIPVAVKDLCYTSNVPTMGGTAVLRDHIPQFDATVVSRLYEAGAIILGKLNLTEGAMAGYNPQFDVPENPWKPAHWSGASSSGSGVAAAAGLAYATLGSDTGGSIRHPAAACGTVGLKPTWGLVSRHGVLDLAQSLDHVGPLTRSSVDAALVLQAIAGHDPNDPTTRTGALPDFCALVGQPIKDIRIGWDEHFATQDIEVDYARALRDAINVLGNLGADIVPVAVPTRLREYLSAWAVLCSAEAFSAHQAHFPERANDYGPWFRQWLEMGAQCRGVDYANAHHLRLACNAEVQRMMQDVDVFCCPSTPRAAYPVTRELSYGPIPTDRDPWMSRYTVPMDYAGLPTLSVPCGQSEAGLPLSLQFVGFALGEPRLVQLGSAFEAATPWHTLTPPDWWLD